VIESRHLGHPNRLVRDKKQRCHHLDEGTLRVTPLRWVDRHHHLRKLLRADAGLFAIDGRHGRIALGIPEKPQLDVDRTGNLDQPRLMIGNRRAVRDRFGVRRRRSGVSQLSGSVPYERGFPRRVDHPTDIHRSARARLRFEPGPE
jgi:hypothetical protein